MSANLTRRAILRGTSAAAIAAAAITSLPAIASPAAPAGNDAYLLDQLRQLKLADEVERIATEAADEAEWAAKEKFPQLPKGLEPLMDCDDLAARYSGEALARAHAALDDYEAACKPILEAHGWPALHERAEAARDAIRVIYDRIISTPAASPTGMLAKLQFLMEITVMVDIDRAWPSIAEAYDPKAAQEDDRLNDQLVISLWADAVRLSGISLTGGAA
jgi:hypothetical protein